MKPVKIREDQGIDLSIKNLAFILSVAIAATIGWFQLENRIGDLETAKKFYSETLGCRLDNSAQEWADVDFWGNELTLHASEHKLDNERHDVDMGNVSVPHFGVHLSRKDFDTLKNRLKEKGAKYYDEPYLRFKGTKYEQETFFVKDPNENILEIKTLTANAE